MYRVEAVGLQKFQLYFKNYDFSMWNLGQFRENLIFVNNCLIEVCI